MHIERQVALQSFEVQVSNNRTFVTMQLEMLFQPCSFTTTEFFHTILTLESRK
jgi:hypothetical protein